MAPNGSSWSPHSWAIMWPPPSMSAVVLQDHFTSLSAVTSPLQRQRSDVQEHAQCLCQCCNESAVGWGVNTVTSEGVEGKQFCTRSKIPTSPTLSSSVLSVLLIVTSSPGVSTGHLYWNKSLYAWGIFSISTGLGKKWVSFWCFLVLPPSLGEPSLFKAT